jgi:hypothetical protein
MPTSASLKKSRSSSLEPEQVVSLVSPMMIHLEEQRRREERERQKVARDYAKLREEQAGRGSLLNFVRYYWHTLEPKTRKLIEGWPLEAICLHLEAITFGDINRLLINVPPGFMKSLMLNVFWPAWEWGPMNMPYLRHLAFSYAQDLTTRDNNKLVKIGDYGYASQYQQSPVPRKGGILKREYW